MGTKILFVLMVPNREMESVDSLSEVFTLYVYRELNTMRVGDAVNSNPITVNLNLLVTFIKIAILPTF